MVPDNDVNFVNGSDDFFDDFLKKQFQNSAEYIEDDNFTEQLLTKLPQSRPINKYLEKLILIVPALVVAAIVFSQLPIAAWGWAVAGMIRQFSVWVWIGGAGIVAAMSLISTFWWVAQEK